MTERDEILAMALADEVADATYVVLYTADGSKGLSNAKQALLVKALRSAARTDAGNDAWLREQATALWAKLCTDCVHSRTEKCDCLDDILAAFSEIAALPAPGGESVTASDFGSVRGQLDNVGRRVDPVVMPESLKDTIATCYGLLWHVETDSKYTHRARRGLLQWITKDEQARGIQNARAIALANCLPLPDGGDEY